LYNYFIILFDFNIIEYFVYFHVHLILISSFTEADLLFCMFFRCNIEKTEYVDCHKELSVSHEREIFPTIWMQLHRGVYVKCNSEIIQLQ